jgi:hypothetical protein
MNYKINDYNPKLLYHFNLQNNLLKDISSLYLFLQNF